MAFSQRAGWFERTGWDGLKGGVVDKDAFLWEKGHSSLIKLRLSANVILNGSNFLCGI